MDIIFRTLSARLSWRFFNYANFCEKSSIEFSSTIIAGYAKIFCSRSRFFPRLFHILVASRFLNFLTVKSFASKRKASRSLVCQSPKKIPTCERILIYSDIFLLLFCCCIDSRRCLLSFSTIKKKSSAFFGQKTRNFYQKKGY